MCVSLQGASGTGDAKAVALSSVRPSAAGQWGDIGSTPLKAGESLPQTGDNEVTEPCEARPPAAGQG